LEAAMHAHNQFIDVLARAGLVGASCLVFYWVVLLYWSIRAARHTGGLSVLLCTALYMRSVSEIPFLMSGYGVDFLVHILLLALICGAHEKMQIERQSAKSGKQSAATQKVLRIGVEA
jgi:O-antigen ligase